MKQNEKETIVNYILSLIERQEKSIAQSVVNTFGISKSTVYNYINELEEKQYIVKDPFGSYILRSDCKSFIYRTGAKLDEDRIFDRDIASFLPDSPETLKNAWRYAFTEMMNNAIEHAHAKEISCTVTLTKLYTQVEISDDGIGIFKNIRDYVKETTGDELTYTECASLLLAGKFTTSKDTHSGEGIFFTSHLMDKFSIVSDGTVFTRNNYSDLQFENRSETVGTKVYMRLSNTSKKSLKAVFDRFSDSDDGFFRTQIPISHMFPNGAPVSRSEARRLGDMLTRFGEVILDFSDVGEIGQAFAHELFIVWQNRNPGIKLEIQNVGDEVLKMISRVKNTK